MSARAVLGLILTKAIYLLQDTEKIGLHIQLINEAMETLEKVFNVRGNQDFSELLHLCLFALDKVSCICSHSLNHIGLRLLQRTDV